MSPGEGEGEEGDEVKPDQPRLVIKSKLKKIEFVARPWAFQMKLYSANASVP